MTTVDDGVTEFGFRWGPMTVERCFEHRGTRVVLVKAKGHTLEIAVSPKGNSIRAWLDHKRLDATDDDRDEHVSRIVLESAWPLLSAGLRELAAEWVKRNPDEWHRFGAQRGIEASREAHARELLQELDRIDKELGND